MRTLFAISLVLLVAFFTGCMDGSPAADGGDLQSEENNSLGNTATADSDVYAGIIEGFTDDEVRVLLKEILGGMIFRHLSVESISGIKRLTSGDRHVGLMAPRDDSRDGKKTTVNVGFSASVEDIELSLNIDEVVGTAIVDAFGTLEEIMSEMSTGAVSYFAPLELDITLDSFTFNREELGEVVVDGDVYCRFKGRYEGPIDKLFGKGTCNTGTEDGVEDIVVVIDGESHLIRYNVDLKAYGKPFDIESYTVSGEFIIDDQPVDLTSL